MATENAEITLGTGSKLLIKLASFEAGMALMQAVSKASAGSPADSSLGSMTLVSNRDVRDALFACFNGCVLNGVKITRDTFEEENARADYILVALEVITKNLEVFTKGLSS